MSAHGKMRPARARRRGQALLIAVLLMVFAAVLGATFVTVVALNLNQTARSGSVNTARVAAIAGSNYVNDQLTNSPLGERWNPIDSALPPAPGDSDFTYYYTDYERSQGWTRMTPHPTADLNGNGTLWPADTDDDRIAVLNDLAAGGSTFAKFPDPRSTTITGNNTPTYLAKVETVNPTIDSSADPARAGQLKITVIGRASDNDAAYSTLVFYKPTTQNGNMFSFARYDSNWNFRTGRTLTTQTTDSTTGASFPVADVRGFSKGMTVIFGSGATVTYNGVIADVVPFPSPNAPRGFLKLATPLTSSIPQGTKVRLASPYMGGLLNIDATGTENPAQATATPYEYDDVLAAGASPSGGIMVNNAMYLEGKSQFTLKTTGPNPDRVLVRGPISIGPNAVANVTNGGTPEDIKTASTLAPFVRYQESEEVDPTDRRTVIKPLTPARLDSPNSRWLQLTKLSDINNGSLYGYGNGIYIDNKEDVEAIQKSRPNTANDAVITTFRKMTIGQTLRLLQRKSIPLDPADPDTADTVKAFTINHLVGGVPQPETFDKTPGNTDLQFGVTPAPIGYRNADAVTPPSSVSPSLNTFNRLSFARVGVDTYQFPIQDAYADQPFKNIGSLEQRGVRGWVSPFEFLPRGALIELRGTDIIITRDDLSDAPEKIVDVIPPIDATGYEDNPRYNRPDENKAWKNTDGTPLTNPGARTYRMRISIAPGPTYGQRWVGAPGYENLIATKDFNGVIYAEGNVRVRGISNKDVTIVSMGNIYVEGGINKDPNGGHVALLAKRNVVLNPTEFAARPTGLQVTNLVPNTTVTTAISAVSTSTIDVSVDEVSGFRIGDRVRIGTPQRTLMVRAISAVSGPGTITLDNPADPITGVSLTLDATANSSVSVVDDAALSAGANQQAYTVSSANTFSRDLLRDGSLVTAKNTTPTPLYQLAIMHAGQFKPGIQMTRTAPTDGTINIKTDANSDGIIQATEKQFAASDTLPYDLVAPSDDTLGKLLNRFSPPVGPDTNPNWDMTLAAPPTTNSYRLTSVSVGSLVSGVPRFFLLTTSVGAYWANSATPNFIIGSGFTPQDDPALPEVEDFRTVREQFYGRYDSSDLVNPFKQAAFQGTTYTLPAQPNASDPNTIALRRAVTLDQLANEYVAAVKYDRASFPDVVADPVNVKVQATIYAQDGTWFVIGMPTMTPNNAAPQAPDIDQANRYRRLNYQITVKANIAENFAPTGLLDYDGEQTPDQSPTVTQILGPGAQAQWLDSSAYPVEATGATWQSINYLAPDPLPLNNTLYLPITPDIINQR